MTLYRNEQAFKSHLMDVLRWSNNYFVTPIQTRTVPGVPDLFVAHFNTGTWIECKRIHMRVDLEKHTSQYITVPFQAGQQAWAYKYWQATKGLKVLLLVAFDNVVGSYRMSTVREGGRIMLNEFVSTDIVDEKNILST